MNFKRATAIPLLFIIVLSSLSLALSASSASGAPSEVTSMGFPAKLDVILAPSKVPAYERWWYNLIVVRLLDSYGKPALAAENTLVTLTSSNPDVGTIPYGSVTINRGACRAETHFYSTFKPGTTTIEASAPYLNSGSAVMTTVGATPTKLVVTLAPSKLPSDDRVYYYPVIVHLQDSAGNPAFADSDIQVALKSSNPSAGTVPGSISIQAGYSHGYTSFDTTATAGSTTITASAIGLTSGSAVMTTKTGGAATKLAVILAPSKLRAWDRTYYYPVVVQAQDASGNPSINALAISVSMASSDATVGSVVSSLTISASANFQMTYFVATHKPGSTTLSASALGLTPGSAVMTTTGTTPTKLVVNLAPPELPAYDTTHYYPVRIQIQDDAGNPAMAATAIGVSLSSSDTTVGSVPATVTIYSGETWGATSFDTTYMAGSTTVSASVFGLISGSAVMATFGATPTKLVVTLAPSKLPNDGKYNYVVLVQLQNSAGNPAFAPVDIGVTLTSSNTAVGTVQNPITISRGSSYFLAWFDTTTTAGSTTITASAIGLTSGSAVMTTKTGGAATKLAVILAPSKLYALDWTYYYPVVVQAQDASGNPSVAASATRIIVQSSDTTIGASPVTSDISAGYSHTILYFDSTYKMGTTTLTAYAPGLSTGSAVMTTGRWWQQQPLFDLSDYPVPFVIGGVLDTTFVVGGTHAHGPFGWGAWTVDVMGAIGTSSTLGSEATGETHVNMAVDDDIANYPPVSVDWTKVTTRTVISVGSGAVNLVSLKYNATLPYSFVRNATGVFIKSTSGKSYGNGWGYDHFVIGLVYEPAKGYVLVCYGIGGQGSQAASLILQNYKLYPQILTGKAVIAKWQDMNGNNTPDLSDQFTLIESTP